MKIFTAFLCILFFLSCQDKKSKYVLDEKSEMAKLMLDMHSDLENIQDKIKQNQNIGKFPENYNKIISAPMTQEGMRTESWESLAIAMIEAKKSLYEAQPEFQEQAYKDAVNSCIACHQAVGCRGPIPKIKKLAWKP